MQTLLFSMVAILLVAVVILARRLIIAEKVLKIVSIEIAIIKNSLKDVLTEVEIGKN